MTSKPKNTSLIKRLKSLFVRKNEVVETYIAPSSEVQHYGEGFRAGAAVTFITPIGAYAGNNEKDAERTRAIAQFHQMNTTTHTTIN
jgi:hypothetical protein